MKKYRIFPKPKKVVYLDNSFKLGNVCLNIDKFAKDTTKDKAQIIFEELNINLCKSSEETIDTKVFIGIDRNYQDLKGYKLCIENNSIKIIAKDQDMAYYALLSLKQILSQSEDTIQCLYIEDYPSFDIRGIIEGYYGVPWTFQERKDLMKFGAKLKNNVFIYAPKDDPYHRERWYDLYPDEYLDQLSQLAQLGKETRNMLVWTIAPFYKQGINEDNLEESIKLIVAKFEQMYHIGVRQFGVLADDVGAMDPMLAVKVMAELSRWKSTKNGVRDFIFCPGSYSLTDFWDAVELNIYEKNFPDDVHLIHTGAKVCAALSCHEIQEYKNKEISEEYKGENVKRRDPVFWLNWPVNDIDKDFRKLHLGAASMLESDLTGLKGLIINPMQEAYASLIAIYQMSLYSWNNLDFDSDMAWESAINYLEVNCPRQLQSISKHMSNQDARGIYGLNESWDLDEMLQGYKGEQVELTRGLKEYFSHLIEDIDIYLINASNLQLRNDLLPYINNLRAKSQSIVYYLDARSAFMSGSHSLAKALFDEAELCRTKAGQYSIVVDPANGRQLQAQSGTKVINPLLEDLREDLIKYLKIDKYQLGTSLYYSGYANSKFYRIPMLFKTEKGSLLAICDRRNNVIDDFGDIDLVVRRREKGGVFSDQKKIVDLPAKTLTNVSSFSIDASIVQSKKSHRIFLFTTVYPVSKGFEDTNLGSGYVEVDGKKYLELIDRKGQRFYLRGSKVFTMDGKDTAFSVKIDDVQPFTNLGSVYQGEMLIGNLLANIGPFSINTSSYILMVSSDDDGISWKNPRILNGSLKKDFMKFLGISPSKGLYLEDGRMVVPAYFTNEWNDQSSCFIISDNDGETWRLGAMANDKRKVEGQELHVDQEYKHRYCLGESSPVLCEDGSIMLIMRNYHYGRPLNLLYAKSLDKGDSFEKTIGELAGKSQSWCQMSALILKRKDKEYLIVSQPSSYGNWNRLNGYFYLYEIVDGSPKYIKSKIIDSGNFQYSSLVQIDDNHLAAFYEKGENMYGDRPQLIYKEFDLDYIFEDSLDSFNVEYRICPNVKEINYDNEIIEYGFIETGNIESKDNYLLNMIEDMQASYSYPNIDKSLVINLEFIDNKWNDRFDYYEIYIGNQIYIKAIDEYSAHYALLTLEQILKQAKGMVRSLEIKDYANQKIRGVIEGYYGIPWGNKKRGDIMEFSSRMKGNVFIFAPKDDPYHREKWYEPYPIEMLEEIGELATLGGKIKTRYLWTISPFKKDSWPISEDNYHEALEKLIGKFEQLYSCGVRQFGVLGDDVGQLPRSVVIKVMNELSTWRKNKKDVYELLFVPESYVLADWGFNPDELDDYSKNFPDDVYIMFTGDNTCAPLTQRAINSFKHRDCKIGERLDPLFWLNWPVNDMDRTEYRRVFMGKASMLEARVKNLVGTITNPMEEAYASMPAIYQVLDYGWNTEMFNCEKSWEASFDSIDSKCSKQLMNIAKHMASSDQTGIEGSDESELLYGLYLELEGAMNSQDTDKRLYLLRSLQEEFEQIKESIVYFEKNSDFVELKADLNPYLENLLHKVKAALIYLECIYAKGYTDINKKELQDMLELATIEDELASKMTISTKTAEFEAKELMAMSGSKHLNSIVANLKNLCDKMN